MAQCFCCKKTGFRLDDMVILKSKDKKLSTLCVSCRDNIRNAFSYYVGGKQISKEEFDKRTKGGDIDECSV